MLQRIFLIVAILAGIGVIVLTQTKLKEHVNGIIDVRNKNVTGWTNEIRRANGLAAKLSETTAELNTTKENLTATKSELESAKSNLETARNDRDKAQGALEKAKDDIKARDQELAQWQNLGIKPDQVKETVAKLAESEIRITKLTKDKEDLDRKRNALQAELDKLLGGEDFWVKMPEAKPGEVLVVDPKWEFVVINVGENQGMLKDGIMVVHRNNQLVGKVRITTVMSDRCVANVMPGWKLGEIREKDQVLYLPK